MVKVITAVPPKVNFPFSVFNLIVKVNIPIAAIKISDTNVKTLVSIEHAIIFMDVSYKP